MVFLWAGEYKLRVTEDSGEIDPSACWLLCRSMRQGPAHAQRVHLCRYECWFLFLGQLGGLPGAVSRRHISKKNNYPVADDTVSTGLRVKKPVADRNIICAQ